LSLGDIDRGATSVRNRLFFERVDIVIRDILLEKLDADIESMLASIRELRERPIIRSGRMNSLRQSNPASCR